MITADEAEGMLCPLAQHGEGYCQGIKCMAFRSTGVKDGCGANELFFCGLAGKPSQVFMTEALAGARMLKDILYGGAA